MTMMDLVLMGYAVVLETVYGDMKIQSVEDVEDFGEDAVLISVDESARLARFSAPADLWEDDED